MKDPIKSQLPISPDQLWAKGKLDDVLFGCVLNIKLYQSGICGKLLIEMSSQDFQDYNKLLETILFAK